MPLRWLLSDLIFGLRGDHDSVQRVRQDLETLARNRSLRRLAAVLRRILNGDRDGFAEQLKDAVSQSVVRTVLTHLGPE
jgi:hypothetical protein